MLAAACVRVCMCAYRESTHEREERERGGSWRPALYGEMCTGAAVYRILDRAKTAYQHLLQFLFETLADS